MSYDIKILKPSNFIATVEVWVDGHNDELSILKEASRKLQVEVIRRERTNSGSSFSW